MKTRRFLLPVEDIRHSSSPSSRPLMLTSSSIVCCGVVSVGVGATYLHFLSGFTCWVLFCEVGGDMALVGEGWVFPHLLASLFTFQATRMPDKTVFHPHVFYHYTLLEARAHTHHTVSPGFSIGVDALYRT
ncbi:unnamed protein product [Pylaiella littoralis]